MKRKTFREEPQPTAKVAARQKTLLLQKTELQGYRCASDTHPNLCVVRARVHWVVNASPKAVVLRLGVNDNGPSERFALHSSL